MKLSAITHNNPYSKSQSFGTKVFEIANIDDLPCAYCGREMISLNTLNKVFPSKVCVDSTMLDRAREYGRYLHMFQQNVINYLTGIQYAYGLDSDGEILSVARRDASQEVERDITERFHKIVDIIEASRCRKMKDFLGRNKEYVEQALQRKKSYPELLKFVRAERFLNIRKSDKRGAEGKINEIIADIETPSEFAIEDYLLRKSKGECVEDFYKNLFDKSISSIEHLNPRARGGTDDISNFLSVCRSCNNKRGFIPLSVYVKSHPDIIENTALQLEVLSKKLPKLISERKIDKKYKDYPSQVSDTLRDITGGQINIKV